MKNIGVRVNCSCCAEVIPDPKQFDSDPICLGAQT